MKGLQMYHNHYIQRDCLWGWNGLFLIYSRDLWSLHPVDLYFCVWGAIISNTWDQPFICSGTTWYTKDTQWQRDVFIPDCNYFPQIPHCSMGHNFYHMISGYLPKLVTELSNCKLWGKRRLWMQSKIGTAVTILVWHHSAMTNTAVVCR